MEYLWGHNRRYNAYSNYIKEKYGGRIQKVSLDAGFNCPNIDGTINTGGCIYCNNKGFNPSYCNTNDSIHNQLNEGIKFLSKRYRANKYIAYFQAYTNTYGHIDKLKEAYNEALSHPEISGIAIGTRPDCITEEILNYLEEIAKNKIVILEYGIESCYDKTLKLINRGHNFEKAKEAIELSANRGIHLVGHIIFGLPEESREEMLNQAKIISELPINSIKFHQLQILKDTEIAKMYEINNDIVKLFSLDEYIEFISEFLCHLRPSLIVQRLTSESPPYIRIAPFWGNYRTDVILNKIEKYLEENNLWQGKYWNEK